MGDEGLTAVTCKSPSNSLRIPSLSFSSDSSELPITSLLSPPIDSPQIEEEQGNFYVLEKDSLRRTFIVKVLYDNAECIGEIWMNVLTQKTPEIVLKMDHLKVLLDGLREFIPEQNRIPLQQAISQLKEDLEFDGVAVNHMHLALYVFQDAVKYVLKQQNIMPHWIFSLDNLVRSSVQAAISILSPELGDNLEGRNYENEVEEMSTFGVSTINSTKPLLNTPLYVDAEIVQLQQKNERLIQENIKLMKKQIAANEACQILLKKCIEEKTTHVNLLEFGILQNTSNPGTHSSSNLINYDSDTLINNDFKELHEWLKEIGVDEESIKMFADQMYTKDDVLTLMTREDLRHLRLRGGIELKIWHHIINHRKQTA